jgi:hypothetical protein
MKSMNTYMTLDPNNYIRLTLIVPAIALSGLIGCSTADRPTRHNTAAYVFYCCICCSQRCPSPSSSREKACHRRDFVYQGAGRRNGQPALGWSVAAIRAMASLANADFRHAASPFLSLQSRASVYFGPWWHERFPRPTGTPHES